MMSERPMEDASTHSLDFLTKEDTNDGHAPLGDIDTQDAESQKSIGSINSVTTSTKKALGFFPLVAIIFYNVSGGPFGMEDAVRSAGPFYALIGFIIFPFVWSLPEAMMVAELSTTFPHASGGVVWVEKAFGPAAGFMTGYLGYIAGVTDNAIYPVLFLDYLLDFIRGDSENEINEWLRFAAMSTTACGLAYINWLGLDIVGNVSIAICILSLSPFVILAIVGAFKVQPSRWLKMPSLPESSTSIMEDTLDDADDSDGAAAAVAVASSASIGFLGLGGILWRPYLNALFWNLNSFDAAACYAEEVDNPGKVIPRAMMSAVVMSALVYIIPLLALLGGFDSEQADWEDGYIAVAASKVVGPILGGWIVFAAGISNLGLFQAELSADAFQLMGMSHNGYVPQFLGIKSRHGTPTYSILLGTFVIIIMGFLNFDELVEMLNFNYSIAVLMEYAAFIKLRISMPDAHRPFRIPLSTKGCILALIPTVTMTLVIMLLANIATLCVSLGSIASGFLLYMIYAKKPICSRYTEVEIEMEEVHSSTNPVPVHTHTIT